MPNTHHRGLEQTFGRTCLLISGLRGLFLTRMNSMGAAGSQQAELEKATWPELYNLAKSHPDSGIAFQSSLSTPIGVERY